MSLKLGKNRTETRSWRPKWSIICHFFCNMRNIWKSRPDSLTITIEQNVQLQVGYTMKKINLIKLKMADLWQLWTSICVITGKPCQIARPLLLNKMCGYVLHAANNQFSDNFNNGGGLLSSVLLFQMIFTLNND